MSEQIGTHGGTPDRPAVFFADASEFRAWLEAHHDTADELWMGLYGKHVPDRGLTWAEAVPEALCFGWIDSLSQRVDEHSRRQRWTPRKPSGNWSAVNVAHVERLIAEGRMHPAGLAAYERRQADKTAIYSYERPAEVDGALADLIGTDPAASAFLFAATSGYRKQALHWVMSAKQEATRVRRAERLRDESSAGRMVPPLRYGGTPAWLTRASEAASEAHR